MVLRILLAPRLCVITAMALLSGCAFHADASRPPAFQHTISTDAKPWSHNRFDNGAEKFTFAIFSDLNGGERERVFEIAVAQLSLLRPELILSVGDLIDGDAEDRAELDAQWNSFDARAAGSIAPVFHVGGNHDLTSLTMRDLWVQRYGRRYYHFIYRNVLFLVLDSEDYGEERMQEIYRARAAALKVLDSDTPERAEEMEYFRMPERMTGEIGTVQSEYFQAVIAQHRDVRWTLMFMHKPVWQRDDEPDFAAIEGALSDRPYTLFNGHLHSYSHVEKNGRDYITLGTTGGGQYGDMSFDHVTLVTMTDAGPSIANLKLEGILDKTGHVPLAGDDLCFQVTKCPPGTAGE